MKTRVVAISHSTGAGGDSVGRAVAHRLGFRYIDEEIITVAANKEGVDAALVADAERRKTFLERLFSRMADTADVSAGASGMLVPPTLTLDETLRTLIIDAIRDTADRGDAVIVSHAASIPLAGRADVLRAFITASFDTRARRVAQAAAGTDGSKVVREHDVARADYFQRFYRIERELPTHYDLVINTDTLTPEEAADIVVATARRDAV